MMGVFVWIPIVRYQFLYVIVLQLRSRGYIWWQAYDHSEGQIEHHIALTL